MYLWPPARLLTRDSHRARSEHGSWVGRLGRGRGIQEPPQPSFAWHAKKTWEGGLRRGLSAPCPPRPLPVPIQRRKGQWERDPPLSASRTGTLRYFASLGYLCDFSINFFIVPSETFLCEKKGGCPFFLGDFLGV